MSWRDFLYFSKGERSGLIVLLCLITIAGILLIWNSKPSSTNDSDSQKSSSTEFTEQSDQQSDSKNANTLSTSNKSSTEKSSTTDKKNEAANASTKSESGVSASNPTKPEQENKKEAVSERVQRLTSYSNPSYSRAEKFKEGTVVELNTADTTILKKVPGIGSSFAKRIISYRNLLGGYYSVTQLSEVYGIDEEKYNAFVSWFSADHSLISTLSVNNLPQDSLRRHPYINYGQAKVIAQLKKQKGKLTGWENLQLLNEFTDTDKIRLQHYLSFE